MDDFEGAKRIFAQLPENDAVKARIRECDDCIQRIHSNAYREAEAKLEQGDYDLARVRFEALGSYRDSAARAEECLQRRLEADYNQAERLMREEKFAEAETAFQKLGTYLDSARQAVKARAALNERHERERRALEAQQKREAAKRRRRKAILLTLVALAVAGYFAATKYFIPKQSYDKAVALRDAGKYEEAILAFEALEGFGDSEEQITETRYQRAKTIYNNGKYGEAYLAFGEIQGYKDADTLLKTDENLLTAAAAAAAAAALDAQFAVGKRWY